MAVKTSEEKLQDYLFTLEICRKHLPSGTHPAHLERLWELERWLKKEFKGKKGGPQQSVQTGKDGQVKEKRTDARGRVTAWVRERFSPGGVSIENFPLLPGGVVIRDRVGGEMLVYLDILTDTIKHTFPERRTGNGKAQGQRRRERL